MPLIRQSAMVVLAAKTRQYDATKLDATPNWKWRECRTWYAIRGLVEVQVAVKTGNSTTARYELVEADLVTKERGGGFRQGGSTTSDKHGW